ncbi:ATP synthase subunit I [Chlamydia sp.]|uniref:ATP synthase subunit I n=1 Tax=Chlamydia sp. TaxID=35827 RepID=UPI0025BCDED9|nr:ATP synthase subunit I [Chlamydia sp.]MBQ8498491.1 ATP synthase subunit I [Chlamydia sp.]
MSSWFAQVIDVSLSQTSDLLDAPLVSEAEKFPYSCSLSKETIPSYAQKIFANFSFKAKNPSPFSSKLQSTKPEDRVFLFGSSPSSQLSSTIRTTTSSPWNLFSQGHTPASLHHFATHSFSSQKSQAQKNPSPSPTSFPSSEASQQEPLFNEPLPQFLSSDENPSSIIEKIPFQAGTHSLEETIPSQQSRKEGEVYQEQKPVPPRTIFSSSESSSTEYQDSSEHSSREDQDPQKILHKIEKRKRRATAVVPVISPPTLGIFSLSYLLTKQGILADFSAYSAYKENLETTQKELTMLHQQRIEQVEKMIAKSKTTRFWDSLASIIATIAPWLETGVAVTIIAMGGGLLSWCALFAALIMIVISLIEAFDGWRAIVKHLPGNDLDKKMRYLGYIKLALTFFSCILSLSSLYVAKLGISPLLEGVVKSISPALTGMLGLTQGIALSLQASSQKIRAHCTKIDSRIECINWERDEYFLRAEQLLDSMQTSFEQLSETLQLQREIDQTFIDSLR